MSASFDFDHNEDIPGTIEDELPSRHRNQPRFQALLKGFGDACQYLEDLMYSYLVSNTLQLANGQYLDFWGGLVGCERGPFDDDTYRELIRSRALINVSDNTIDDIIEVYRQATSAEKVWYYDHHPAGFRVTALRGSFMSDDRVGRVRSQMDLAIAGGVAYTLVEKVPGNLTFGSSTNGFNSTQSRVIN